METLYIVLSVAGVVLVATVILTFFVCLACYQNRKVTKNTQLMKQAAMVSLMKPNTFVKKNMQLLASLKY